ncbi:MAG: ATP-binding protein [Legionellales bacterium]|nr:ATP-binding protein [Legionellales bacterium]
MDSIENPFSPGAGSPPPELVGREAILKKGNILFARVKCQRAEKSLLLTGLRGVGKTVLINELERLAEQASYKTILIEAYEGKSLGVLLIPPLRQLLYQLDRLAGMGNKVRRGLAVLKSFITAIKVKMGEIEVGLDIEPEQGTADSGDLASDLPNLFMAVAEAAQEKQTPIAILIDEIQYLSQDELGALIMAMHKMQQRQLPLVLIGAGLPVLPALVGSSKTYAERLFQFPDIGPLSAIDSIKALQEPVKKYNVKFTEEALEEIFRLTKGYPYFIQEWGYQSWNHAVSSPITLQDVKNSTIDVIRRLDENFFRVRFDRLTLSEQKFLRAMAEFGTDLLRTSDIAIRLGVKIHQIGPVRAKLIKKGMIFSPAHGEIRFTVPLFDEFMKRAIPIFK